MLWDHIISMVGVCCLNINAVVSRLKKSPMALLPQSTIDEFDRLVKENNRLKEKVSYLESLLERWVQQYGKVEKMNKPLATDRTIRKTYIKKNKQ